MLGKQIMITDKSLLRFKNNGKFDDPFFKTSAQTFFKWWLGDWGLVFIGGAVLNSFLCPFSWSLSMSLPSMQTDFNVSHYLPWQSIIFPGQTSSANKVLVKKSSFAPLEYINSWRRWVQLNAHDFPHKWIMFLEGLSSNSYFNAKEMTKGIYCPHPVWWQKTETLSRPFYFIFPLPLPVLWWKVDPSITRL